MLKLICSTLVLSAALFAQQPLEILEGVYGAGNFQMNVTPKLQALVQNNVLEMAVDPAVLGGDPAPGQAKRLRVRYRVAGGAVQEFSAGDFERFRLPPAPSGGSGNWAAGAIPGATQQTPAQGGGFSIGDIWGQPGQVQLKIVAARYGAGNRFVDVRERLQALVKDNALNVRADNAAFGDPAPAVAKTLEVTYEYRGAPGQTSVKEGATLTLPPAGAATAAAAATAPPVLRVVSARYGGDNRFVDVRERLQGMVRDNRLAVKADNATMGSDPAVGKNKSLEIVYQWSGAYYSSTLREGRSATYPEAGARPMANPPAEVNTAGATSQPPVVAANPGQLPAMSNSTATPTPSGTSSGNGPVASPGQVAPLGSAGGLRIFYARYGPPGQEVDVRERLRPLLHNDAMSFVVGPQALSDPTPGVAKRVTVIYEFKGRTYEKAGADGESIQLP